MSEPNDPTPAASGQNPAGTPDQDKTEVVGTAGTPEATTVIPGASAPGAGGAQQFPPGYGQQPYAQPYPGQPYGAPAYPGQQYPPQQPGGQQYADPQYGSAPYGGQQYPPQQYAGQPYGDPQYGAQYGSAQYGAGQQQPYGQGGYGAPSGSFPAQASQPPSGAFGTQAQQPAGQFGGDQFSSMAKSSGGPSARTWLLAAAGGVALIVAILLITAFWLPGWAPKSLSQTAVQDGVKQILTRDYQAADVSNVSCPSGEKVAKGHSFSCTVTIGGQQQQVKVTLLDDDGKYEVSRPTS